MTAAKSAMGAPRLLRATAAGLRMPGFTWSAGKAPDACCAMRHASRFVSRGLLAREGMTQCRTGRSATAPHRSARRREAGARGRDHRSRPSRRATDPGRPTSAVSRSRARASCLPRSGPGIVAGRARRAGRSAASAGDAEPQPQRPRRSIPICVMRPCHKGCSFDNVGAPLEPERVLRQLQIHSAKLALAGRAIAMCASAR